MSTPIFIGEKTDSDNFKYIGDTYVQTWFYLFIKETAKETQV